MIPLLVATGADPNAKYCDGCFVSIATDIAGPWLGIWITVSAAISCIGLFIAEMGKRDEDRERDIDICCAFKSVFLVFFCVFLVLLPTFCCCYYSHTQHEKTNMQKQTRLLNI
jgi:hypothetical protein